MSTRTLLTRCTILIIAAGLWACSSASPQFQSAQNTKANLGMPATTRSSSSADSVRTIDFANFVYPAKAYFPSEAESLPLKEGRYEGDSTQDPVILASVAYGDVTADKVEDAIVVLGVSVEGSAIPHIVYIYTKVNGAPKLLWAFQTGDRGAGGLRQASPDRGELIVELYGQNKVIGKNLYESDPFATEGVCCPQVFTHARYTWAGDHFKQDGAAEVMPNPAGDGALIMAPFR